MADITFRYFRSVAGMVVPRYGTVSFIGAMRDKVQGWVWDTDLVVRIPEFETTRYLREYRRALADGALVECSQADFEALEKTESEPTSVVRGTNRRHKVEEE